MTLTAGALAGLLAARHPDFHAGWFALAFVGIVLAHVSNNLMNDLFDTDVGLDTEDYPRALYAPHPILSGMISRRGLATAAAGGQRRRLRHPGRARRGAGLARGRLRARGFLLSVAYTAPPLRLKRRGLGELDVFVVWGPLMVAGHLLLGRGRRSLAGVGRVGPLRAAVHGAADGQAHRQAARGTSARASARCPVVLGETRARAVTQGMMIAFYPAVGGLRGRRGAAVADRSSWWARSRRSSRR